MESERHFWVLVGHVQGHSQQVLSANSTHSEWQGRSTKSWGLLQAYYIGPSSIKNPCLGSLPYSSGPGN